MMRTLVLLAILGSIAAPETRALEPCPITAEELRQWTRHAVPLPQKMEIAAEVRVRPDRVGVSVPQTDHPVVRQALKELRSCVGAFPSVGHLRVPPDGPAAEPAFRITLQLGGPEVSPLDSVPNRDQAYRIFAEAEHAGLRIVARTPVGLLYGVKTLAQLISTRATADELCIPVLQVIDWPDVAERGFWGTDSFPAVKCQLQPLRREARTSLGVR